MRLLRSSAVWVFLVFLFAGFLQAIAIPVKQLPPYYRQWLEEDVVYIINQQERTEFLKLKTDAERDSFITVFWKTRNPDPHSDINSFKEEHYRRLAYVRANFGDSRYNDGWRTDMGHMYITLGAPKQRAQYHIGISTRPAEIWFYESPSPALPPFFNLVFFKESPNEDYRLYSPVSDGPTKIVTNDTHSNAQALHTIDQSMGPEATHAMVSLLPDEPIDIDDPRPTMSSDLLIGAIRDLPDQKLEKDRIAALRAAVTEKVTSSIFTGGNPAVLDTAQLRDDQGRTTVSFLLRNQQTDARLIGPLGNNRTGYNLQLQTRVLTADGKAVYQQSDNLQGTVSETAAAAAKEKLFAVEGRLPLVPGQYQVETVLTNLLTHEATRTSRTLTVAAAKPDALGVSDLLAYTKPSPVRDPGGLLPFSMANLRFTPQGPQSARIHVGEQVPLVYQVWFPAADAKPSAAPAEPKRIHIHYLVGSVALSAARAPVEEDEEVEVKNLDAAGNLLTGHTIDTSKLPQGTYRIVVRVSESGTPRTASSTMTLRVLPPEFPVGMWTAFAPETRHPIWQEDVERGVAAEAMGDFGEAAASYRRALAVNPKATDAQTRLDALPAKQAAQHARLQ